MQQLLEKIRHDQSGQILPVALIIMAVGALLVGAFMSTIGSTLLTVRVYSEPVPDNYTADAGIEDAIWGLQYGTLGTDVAASGGQLSYTMTDVINEDTADVTVTDIGGGTPGGIAVIAHDDFEDHPWKGYQTEWLSDWAWDVNQDIEITKKDEPIQPDYHAHIFGPVVLQRDVDLTGHSDVHLLFGAKAMNFEPADYVQCRVSSDNVHWDIVQVWGVSDSDGVYRLYDIDLSPYDTSGTFWIGFRSLMTQNGRKDEDDFYFDVVQLVGTGTLSQYRIESEAGVRLTTVTVEIDAGTTKILSWEIE